MLPRGESRQERFVAWCECFDGAKHLELRSGVLSLTSRTVFEGRSAPTLVAEAGRTVAEHAKRWLEELNAINTQLGELSAKDAENQHGGSFGHSEQRWRHPDQPGDFRPQPDHRGGRFSNSRHNLQPDHRHPDLGGWIRFSGGCDGQHTYRISALLHHDQQRRWC